MQIGKANDQPNFKINKKQVFDWRNVRIYKKKQHSEAYIRNVERIWDFKLKWRGLRT